MRDSIAVCEDLDAGRTLCSVITHSNPARSLATRGVVCEPGGEAVAMTLCAGAVSSVPADRGGRAKDGPRELRTVGSRHWHGKGT